MSARRRHLILDLLAEQPLPVEVLEQRLARRLADARLPPASKRTVQLDIQALGREQLIRRRSASEIDPPAAFAKYRSFYERAGDLDIVLLDQDHELLWLNEN